MRSFHGCFLPGFSSFGQAVSEKIFFRNLPTRNKNCIWQPSLLTDQNKRTNLNRGPSIDTSYQVLVHLAKRFQRRRFKCEKLTDDGHKVMAKAHMAFRPGELKITKTGFQIGQSSYGTSLFSQKAKTCVVIKPLEQFLLSIYYLFH